MDQTHAGVFDHGVALVAVGAALDCAHDPLGAGVAEHEARAVNGVRTPVGQAVGDLVGDENRRANHTLFD